MFPSVCYKNRTFVDEKVFMSCKINVTWKTIRET